MGSNSVLTTLIQDAILKLCTQNVLFDASLEIDGIICISPGQESKEIVVKMHRTIMKPTPEPEVFQPEPSPKSTPHRRNRNQQAHSSNIESDTFPAQTSNISFDEMPKHDTYQDESGGATAYFPDEQQQYDTTPSKQSRKRRQPQTPTDTSSEEKYIKVEPGEGEILVEEPTNMPAAGESNDSYSDTSQGVLSHNAFTADTQTYQNNTQGPQHQNNSQGPQHQNNTQGPHHQNNTQGPQHQTAPGQTFSILIDDPSNCDCTTCGRTFPSKACMESHHQLIHNKYCDVCNSRLDEESNIEEHGLTHTGLKPLQCQYCYRLFNTKTGIFNHTAKDLYCTLCDKSLHISARSKHLRFHNFK